MLVQTGEVGPTSPACGRPGRAEVFAAGSVAQRARGARQATPPLGLPEQELRRVRRPTVRRSPRSCKQAEAEALARAVRRRRKSRPPGASPDPWREALLAPGKAVSRLHECVEQRLDARLDPEFLEQGPRSFPHRLLHGGLEVRPIGFRDGACAESRIETDGGAKKRIRRQDREGTTPGRGGPGAIRSSQAPRGAPCHTRTLVGATPSGTR